jgi:endonuclease/exonuclease/phosphatase family metal-dependent hydrolase
MITRLFRRRPLPGQTVGDPTLLTLTLTALAALVFVGATAAAVWVLNPIGYDGLVAVLLAGALAWLLAGVYFRRPEMEPLSPRRRWLRRVRVGGRLLVALLLACWLGLILWEPFSSGGKPPPAPEGEVRVVTWNLHCGQSEGPVWLHFDWLRRRDALRPALAAAAPDLLCVQEAVQEQVQFLEEVLPHHGRVGVGRDDGHNGGEFCAIYFNRRRFQRLDDGTFWLEEPTDRPRGGPNVKRICTWVRLRDRQGQHTLRVYNTHNYLMESYRQEAARIILAHVRAGDPADALILCADFNATPDAQSRLLFRDAGLADSAARAGASVDTPTFQFHGVRLWNIDGILVSPHWRVQRYHVLDVKPDGVFPSDHFGVLADLTFAR